MKSELIKQIYGFNGRRVENALVLNKTFLNLNFGKQHKNLSYANLVKIEELMCCKVYEFSIYRKVTRIFNAYSTE